MDFLNVFIAEKPMTSAILIIVCVFLAIWFVDVFFEFLLEKIFSKTKGRFDDRAIRILKRGFIGYLFLGSLYMLLPTLQLKSSIYENAHKVLVMLFIFFSSFIAIQLISAFFRELEKTTKAKDNSTFYSAEPFLNSMSKLLALVIGAFVMLAYLGIDLTPLIASAGVAGAVLAFAARDFVANLFGGVSVFFDKPYRVGDFVIVNNDHRGEVIEIGARSTKIKTRDNVLITIPNAVMVTNAVINETGFDPSLRIHLPILVAYGVDLDDIEEKLIKATMAIKEVEFEREPLVRYRSFADSGVELELLVTIKEPKQKGKTTHILIKNINKMLIKEKIRIPYTSRDVHMHK